MNRSHSRAPRPGRNRTFSIDSAIFQFDAFLKTTTGTLRSSDRPSPAVGIDEVPLETAERKLSAALMRVNHTGEVCAQALYLGQSLTARRPKIARQMDEAAAEEKDHLVWCEQRLQELGARPSLLNPIWYLASAGLGATAGALGDRTNLGFVAATEEEVERHLQSHLTRLPENDRKSRAIVVQMHADEVRHKVGAVKAGARRFPAPLKSAMRVVSRLMTGTSYWI
jgi:ubiquinone biosynthesis monooxygenase Coq7